MYAGIPPALEKVNGQSKKSTRSKKRCRTRKNLPVQGLYLPPRDVGTLVPRLGPGEQRVIPLCVTPLGPLDLLLRIRLDARDALLLERLDDALQPFSLDLHAAGPVTKRRRRLRAVEEEHVGEAVQGDAHGRLEAVLPVLGNGLVVGAADVELRERAGHTVEARCERDDVEFLVAGFGADAGFGDFDNRVGHEVDEVDVGKVVDFVVVLLERGPLGAPGVDGFGWGEDGGFLGIVDAGADVVAPEVVGLDCEY